MSNKTVSDFHHPNYMLAWACHGLTNHFLYQSKNLHMYALHINFEIGIMLKQF